MTCALGQILFSAVSQLPSVCAQMNDHWLWVYIYCTDVVVSSLSTTTVMVFLQHSGVMHKLTHPVY